MAVKGLWKSEYQCLDLIAPGNTSMASQKELDLFDEFLQLTSNSVQVNGDEYDLYCGNKLDSQAINIISWWVSMLETYPRLAQMALDMLCIPAISAECKRVFSSSKLIVIDRQNWLKDDIIEAGECLYAWIYNDVI